MTIGQSVREAANASYTAIKAIGLALALMAVPSIASAAPAAAPAASVAADAAAAEAKPSAAAPVAAAPAPEAPKIDPNDPRYKVAPGGYTPMKPVPGVGMPINGAFDVQTQYSPNGKQALKMHNGLVWVMAVIALASSGRTALARLRNASGPSLGCRARPRRAS